MLDINKSYSFFSRHAAGLCAFVTVARHQQLSSAARELQISQPGLSQRLKNIEDSLGVRLFDRNHRGVTLSRAGRELLTQVEPLLTPLALSLSSFAARANTPGVLLSADFAFASFWLLPRLPDLREAIHPIDISILTSQVPDEIGGVHADLIIRMATSDEATPRETKMFDENVFAVCSPAFLERHPNLTRVEDLLTVPLLSLSGPLTSRWYDWHSWFRHFDISLREDGEKTNFNSYDIVVRAAIDGLGIALGWEGLIDEFLDNGSLVKVIPHVASSTRGYYVRMSQDTPSDAARQLHDWVINEVTPPTSAGS